MYFHFSKRLKFPMIQLFKAIWIITIVSILASGILPIAPISAKPVSAGTGLNASFSISNTPGVYWPGSSMFGNLDVYYKTGSRITINYNLWDPSGLKYTDTYTSPAAAQAWTIVQRNNFSGQQSATGTHYFTPPDATTRWLVINLVGNADPWCSGNVNSNSPGGFYNLWNSWSPMSPAPLPCDGWFHDRVLLVADDTGPSITALTASPSNATSQWVSNSVTLSASASDGSGSGTSVIQYSVNGGAFTNGSSYSFSNGSACVAFRGIDMVGNVGATSSQICGYSDTTLPGATGALSTSARTNGPVVVTVTPTDSGGSLPKDARCKVGAGGTWSAYANPVTCSVSLNNSIVYWESRDNANNTGSGSLQVTNINDPPNGMSLSGSTQVENTVGNIGTFSTTDATSGDTFTYSLVSGTGSTDNASFTITGNTLSNKAAFNYEGQKSYSIRVRTTDSGGLWWETPFTISVTDVNEAPTGISLSNQSVAENAAIGTLVGALSTVDPDAGNTFTYTVRAGNFTISGTSLLTAGSWNYENAGEKTQSVTIRSTDQSGAYKDTVFSISVTNVNEPPTGITLSPQTVAENASSGTFIGDLSTTDPDTGDVFTYSVQSGSFTISGGKLYSAAVFNYEAGATQTVTIRSTDQSGSYIDKAFTITVTDVNEAPTFVFLTKTTVEENAGATVVGNLQTSDPDAGNTITYTLLGLDAAKFSISDYQLKTVESFDYESLKTFYIIVRATDQGGLYKDQAEIIEVTNVNENPTGITLANQSVSENQALGSTVGSFSTNDPDSGNTFSYSLSGSDAASFALSGGNTLITAASFDYESKSSYSIIVRSTDQGGLFVDRAFTISISNADESPSDITLTSTTVAEKLVVGTEVGSLDALDPDANSTFTFSLATGSGSSDNASFSIAGNSLKTAAVFDYAAKHSYSIRVRGTDNTGLTYEKTLTITVLDTTAPVVVINPTTSSYTAASVDVSISATDASSVAHIYCKLASSADFTDAGSGPCTLTLDANGDVQYYAVDSAGNSFGSAQDPKAYTVDNIDTTTPTTPDVSPLNGSWTSTKPVTLSASGSSDPVGILKYQYSANGIDGWLDGNSVSVVTDGTTCYVFRSLDLAGNPSLNSAQVCAFLDTTAPSATVSLSPSSWTNGTVVATIAASDGTSGSGYQDARCKVGQNGAWSEYSAAPSCTTDVNATIYWEARDMVGNVGSGSQVVGNIAALKPTTPTVSATPANWTTAASVTLSATGSADRGGSGLQGYMFSLKNSGIWTGGNAVVVTLAGSTCYEFISIDNVGNQSDPAEICAKIDRTAPAQVLSVTESHEYQSGETQSDVSTPSFTWSAPTGDLSGIRGYNVYFGPSPSGASAYETASPAFTPAAPADGVQLYYLRIRSIDLAGNTSAWRGVYIFNYVAPSSVPLGSVTETTGLSNNTWQNLNNHPSFSWVKPDQYVNQYSVYFGKDPNGTSSTFSSALSFAPAELTQSGKYYLRVQTKNSASSLSSWQTLYTVNYDNVAPANVDYPISEQTGSQNNICQATTRAPVFTWPKPIDDASGVVRYNYAFIKDMNDIDPTEIKSTQSESLTISDVDGGIYFLHLQSVDAAGNASDWGIGYVYCYALGHAVTSSSQTTQIEAQMPKALDTQLQLSLPAQMSADPLKVVVYPPVSESQAPGDLTKLGSSFELEATSVSTGDPISVFSKPYTITLSYAEADVNGIQEGTLKVYYHNPSTGIWEALADSTVDPDANTVTATVNHMSEFSVMGQSAVGTGNSTIVLVSGSLAVTSQHIDFGAVALTGAPIMLGGSTSSWQVVDASGTGAGWHMTLRAEDFVSSGGKTISVSNLSVEMADTDIVKVQGNNKPSSLVPGGITLSPTAQNIMAAPSGSGMGAYQFTPVFTLLLPPSVYAGSYESVVVATAIAGP